MLREAFAVQNSSKSKCRNIHKVEEEAKKSDEQNKVKEIEKENILLLRALESKRKENSRRKKKRL